MTQFEQMMYTELGMEPERVEEMQVKLAKLVIEAGLPEEVFVDLVVREGAVQVDITKYRDSQKFRKRITLTRSDVIEKSERYT